MGDLLYKLIGLGLVVTAAIALWAVLTPHHLFLG